MAKAILSLKKKPETIVPEEIPVNPIASIEVNTWDYTPYADFVEKLPPQRRRRRDKHVDQYRKESKWQ